MGSASSSWRKCAEHFHCRRAVHIGIDERRDGTAKPADCLLVTEMFPDEMKDQRTAGLVVCRVNCHFPEELADSGFFQKMVESSRKI